MVHHHLPCRLCGCPADTSGTIALRLQPCSAAGGSPVLPVALAKCLGWPLGCALYYSLVCGLYSPLVWESGSHRLASELPWGLLPWPEPPPSLSWTPCTPDLRAPGPLHLLLCLPAPPLRALRAHSLLSLGPALITTLQIITPAPLQSQPPPCFFLHAYHLCITFLSPPLE